MTGAEHYRQAEVLLDEILSTEAADATEVEIEIAIRTAQVHATLALVAANRNTADPGRLWEPPNWVPDS